MSAQSYATAEDEFDGELQIWSTINQSLKAVDQRKPRLMKSLAFSFRDMSDECIRMSIHFAADVSMSCEGEERKESASIPSCEAQLIWNE